MRSMISPAPASPGTVVAPTLLNSWVNFGAPYQDARYWKTSLGEVTAAATLKDGSAGAVMFVLPAGYRPAARVANTGWGNSGVAEANVHANGNVDVGSAAGNTKAVVNITFRTD